MEFENKLLTRFGAGKSVFGAALPDASEIAAKFTVNCGIDLLWIDLEHRPYGPFEVRWMPIICRQMGVAAMVRVPGLDPIWAKKALDIGANTIMFPQINTAEEARLAVEYCKYPPQGTRGISPLWTSMMDISWDDYLPAANDEKCVVIQIESPEGMENLDEIAQVEGVDVLFAGPADLSASLGVIGQFDHPELMKYLADFPDRVAEFGKPAGITYSDIAKCQWAFDAGYRLVNVGTILHHGMEGLTKIIRDFHAQDEKK